MKKLNTEGHIERVNEMKDDVFIQPEINTVKIDVEIALDARAFYQAIDKIKYWMPNLENLLDLIAEVDQNCELWCWPLTWRTHMDKFHCIQQQQNIVIFKPVVR